MTDNKELIRITYDDSSNWCITYPQSGKWAEFVSRTTIDEAIDAIEAFLDTRKKVLESSK